MKLSNVFALCCLLCGLAGNSAPAAESRNLLGAWLVQPRSAPGVLMSTATFTAKRDGVVGVWRANDGLSRYSITNVAVSGDIVSFKLADGNDSERWQGRFISDVELRIQPTDSDLPAAVTTLKRLSPGDLAKLQATQPTNLITHKVPLPALKDLPSNGLALTPPMGWNSWNHFLEAIDDRTVRETADALVSSGLRDVGYVYVNIDDGWQGRRDSKGELHSNSKFPDMKALADYIHSKGLKLGLYSSPGPVSCAGYVASHGYERRDADTFARWGVDYLKYDWCSAQQIYRSREEMRALYQKMGEALQATGRPIVYSLCQYGLFDVGSWGRKVGGNSWRISGDIVDSWASMSRNGFEPHDDPAIARPGSWNDPDMLEVGNGGMSEEEYRTHLTLWSIQAAPLILGNDVRTMSAPTLALLLNREVIAIDQDALGIQGKRALSREGTEIWTKPLKDHATAVALFNRGASAALVAVSWSDIGIAGARHVRDVWKHADLGQSEATYQVSIPAHGAVLLRVSTRS